MLGEEGKTYTKLDAIPLPNGERARMNRWDTETLCDPKHRIYGFSSYAKTASRWRDVPSGFPRFLWEGVSKFIKLDERRDRGLKAEHDDAPHSEPASEINHKRSSSPRHNTPGAFVPGASLPFSDPVVIAVTASCLAESTSSCELSLEERLLLRKAFFRQIICLSGCVASGAVFLSRAGHSP